MSSLRPRLADLCVRLASRLLRASRRLSPPPAAAEFPARPARVRPAVEGLGPAIERRRHSPTFWIVAIDPPDAIEELIRMSAFRNARGAADLGLVAILAGASLAVALWVGAVFAAYQLGQSDGRTALFDTAVQAHRQLDSLAPKMDAMTQACWIVRQSTARSHK